MAAQSGFPKAPIADRSWRQRDRPALERLWHSNQSVFIAVAGCKIDFIADTTEGASLSNPECAQAGHLDLDDCGIAQISAS